MSHAHALLTPRTRLRLARLVVESGWTCTAASKMFMVSPRTAAKWADRYRSEGVAGMDDRSSRPHHSPARTPQHVVKQIVRLRWRHRLGPVQIAGRLGVPASTVHAVLVECRINRLWRIDRVTGEPLRRYEHDHSGALIHVDVTKFGNIPDGGGWRYVGRQQGERNRSATVERTGAPRSRTRGPFANRCPSSNCHRRAAAHSRSTPSGPLPFVANSGGRREVPPSRSALRTVFPDTPRAEPTVCRGRPSSYIATAIATSSSDKPRGRRRMPCRSSQRDTVTRCTPRRSASSRTLAPESYPATRSRT